MKIGTVDYAKPKESRIARFALLFVRFRRGLIGSGVILSLYAASYVSLSIYGCYEPIAMGTNWVKNYGWAPSGFVSNFQWRWPLFYFYSPLVVLDRRFWHNGDAFVSGKYPVHRPANIDDVYRAWE